jgi:pyruvate dehydrogenase (quinone)
MSSAIAEVCTLASAAAAPRLDKQARDRRNDSPLYPQNIAATIDKLADNDAVFIFNVGTPSIWAAHLT